MSRFRVLLLVTVFLLSGCSLFEPMVKLQAGKVADRELDARKSDLEGAAEHNREQRKGREG